MKRFIILCLMAVLTSAAWAQKMVEGVVTDAQGEPLAGVHISQSCCRVKTITDMEGRFRVHVCRENTILTFHHLSMQPKEVPVAGVSQLHIVLQEGVTRLDEAVVVSTGYQKISKERAAASIVAVDSTRLTRLLHRDLTSSLEGQVAGLRMSINPNTGEASPVLRGVGTFSSNVGTSPLIVIDDMVTDLSLSDVNTYDVESITVLKDAAASSIYGALAANGVIVITTKQAKSQKTHVSLSADGYISTRPNFDAMHYASSSDIIDYQTSVYQSRVENAGGVSNFFSSLGTNYYTPLYQLYRDQAEGRVTSDEVNNTLSQWRKNDYYEQYRKNVWRNSITQRYNVALSQKSTAGNHYASATFTDDRGRTLRDHSDALNLYYKSTYDISKWLKIKVGIETSYSHGTSPNSSYNNYQLQERYAQIMDGDGNLVYSPYVNVAGYVGSATNGSTIRNAQSLDGLKSYSFNVLESIDESLTHSQKMRLRPFATAEFSFLKMLKYQLMYQYEWNQTRSSVYDGEDTYQMRVAHNAMINNDGECLLPSGGRYFQQTNNAKRYTLRNQLNFERSQNQHTITAFTGLELREVQTPRLIQQLMYGYNDTALTSARMDWASLYKEGWESAVYGQPLRYQGLATSQSETRHRYASFYANAGYNYRGRYNLTGSIRWDEADLFGLDTKEQHHPLWSLGGSWNLSDEEWLKPVSWIDYLKLRMTYGVNGNVDQSSSTYFVARYRTISQDPLGLPYLSYSDDNLPNPKLRWEKTSTLNVGIDFRLFNRLSGSLEGYNRVGDDLLVTKYLDSTLGSTSRVINNGKIRNRGLELSLTYDVYHSRDWQVTATLNHAINSNTMLHVEHPSTAIASSFIMAPTNYFIEGTGYNTLWAYRLSRIENGYPVILDENGNEMATFDSNGTPTSVTTTSSLKGVSALKNCGNLLPTYNGSLGLNASWKGLEVNLLLIYAGGNKLRLDVADLNSYDLVTTHINERFDGTNGVRLYTDMPTSVQQWAGTFSEWWRYSDEQVRRADYLKLRSINIAYRLPEQITRKLHLSTTKITFQTNNLWYWSAVGHDIDPEAYSGNSGTRSLQQPVTFSFGLSTGF